MLNLHSNQRYHRGADARSDVHANRLAQFVRNRDEQLLILRIRVRSIQDKLQRMRQLMRRE